MSLTLGEPTVVSPLLPHGLEAITKTFGDIFAYLRCDHTLDPRWQAEQLTTIPLPFPVTLSWDRSRQVEHITCHKRLRGKFENVFERLLNAGLQTKITSFSGCFCFRPKRSGAGLSAHSWGIAIDLNPESNQRGTAGHMDRAVISVFRDAEFTWGGEWPGAECDPMHFQYCADY